MPSSIDDRAAQAAACAGYGYNNVRTLEDFGACHPNLVPHKPYDPVTDTSWAQQPVAALALIDISRDWHEDLQLCLDLLRYVFQA